MFVETRFITSRIIALHYLFASSPNAKNNIRKLPLLPHKFAINTATAAIARFRIANVHIHLFALQMWKNGFFMFAEKLANEGFCSHHAAAQ
jgi:hypothetical protein